MYNILCKMIKKSCYNKSDCYCAKHTQALKSKVRKIHQGDQISKGFGEEAKRVPILNKSAHVAYERKVCANLAKKLTYSGNTCADKVHRKNNYGGDNTRYCRYDAHSNE